MPKDDVAEAYLNKIIEECRWKLTHELSEPTLRPVGDDAGYVPPASRWLPLLRDALARLKEAEVLALAEVPRPTKREMEQAHFKGDGIVAQLARGDAEVRRLRLVDTVATFLQFLLDELSNEGRPRPLRFFEKHPESEAHREARQEKAWG